jgi:hypothetical protein
MESVSPVPPLVHKGTYAEVPVPVTVPEETVAILGEALNHIPLDVVFDKEIVEPILTDAKPLIAFTVGKVLTTVEIEFEDAGLPIAHALLDTIVA